LSFCLCWANENWTRRWDAANADVLVAQTHSDDDDACHVDQLLNAFRDDRYIKIDDRPLFLVYRTSLLPNAARTAKIWRDKVRRAGFPDLYLVRVESWGDYTAPQAVGFDAAVEFAPEFKFSSAGRYGFSDMRRKVRNRLARYQGNHAILEYEALVMHMLTKSRVDYTRFPCVVPGWDNSPRRRKGAHIFVGSTPHVYENWLRTAAARTTAMTPSGESFVFINAWNEWAEGNHLEPDQRWGRAYLEATARALG
jgi:lipopolysaccharide biosynthesis protein